MSGLYVDNKMGKAIKMVGAMWLWKGETDWKTYSLWTSHSYWASSKTSTHLRVKKHTSLSTVKELETTASTRQIKTFKSETSPPPPILLASWRRESRREVKAVGGVVRKTSLGVKGVVGKIGPWFHLWHVCWRWWPQPPALPFPCQQIFFRANQGQASMCLLVTPLGDPNSQRKVRGSREAVEPWWAICYPALHPLFPLCSGFLLLQSQQSLRVPWNTYPLENIYNLLTSWGHFFF